MPETAQSYLLKPLAAEIKSCIPSNSNTWAFESFFLHVMSCLVLSINDFAQVHLLTLNGQDFYMVPKIALTIQSNPGDGHKYKEYDWKKIIIPKKERLKHSLWNRSSKAGQQIKKAHNKHFQFT